MESIQLTSLAELSDSLGKMEKSFVLLYKGTSESSQCAVKSFISAGHKMDDSLQLMVANVDEVRDIHPEYGVESVPTMLVFKGDALVNLVKGCMDEDFYRSLFEGKAMPRLSAEGESKKRKKVIVYTTPTCSWCTRIKEHLNRHQIEYREVDVASNSAAAEEMRRKSGQMGVPQTEIDGQMIVGFDRPKIDRLLEIV